MTEQEFYHQLKIADAHHRAGQLADAERVYLLIHAAQPKFFPAAQNLGVIAIQQGNFELAVQRLEVAIRLDPSNSDAAFNLILALRPLGRFEQAVQACHRAIQLNPQRAEAYGMLGNCLRDLEQNTEALSAYEKATSLNPNLSSAQVGLGIGLGDHGRTEDSIAAFRRAIELEPQSAIAHWNLALALLGNADNDGWTEYEWRWQFPKFPSPRRHFSKPLWKGEPLDGRTIFIYAEQGFGDSIQFVRYLPLVIAAGGRVILECHASLKKLFESVAHLAEIRTVVHANEDFDFQCPLLSLPLMLGTKFDTIPAAPYLKTDPSLVEKWKTQILPSDGRMRIGLVWACGTYEKRRSLPLNQLIAATTGVNLQFFSLQKGTPTNELLMLPSSTAPIDLTDQLTDFSETAAMIQNLDLVITVDTAVAHVAGAIGAKVWTLLTASADWRWFHNRLDTPWYPSMKLFRQAKMNQWDEFIDRVSLALHEAVREFDRGAKS